MCNEKPKLDFRSLVVRVNEVMVTRLKEEIPEKGKFEENFLVSFNIPGTANQGCLIVECSWSGNIDNRRLSLAAFRRNNDYKCRTYLMNNTHSEIINYLQDESNIENFMGLYMQMSEKIDNLYD